MVAGNSVTCNREVKSFVSQRDGESVGYIGVRVADEGLIAVIDNAVVVQILENHVAGLSVGHDFLSGASFGIGPDVCVYLLLILEDTVGLVTVEEAQRLSHFGACQISGVVGQYV